MEFYFWKIRGGIYSVSILNKCCIIFAFGLYKKTISKQYGELKIHHAYFQIDHINIRLLLTVIGKGKKIYYEFKLELVII